MNSIDYPRFIQNKPTGQDSLEGKSAERVAIAIEEHIKKITTGNEGDSYKLPQIIGLEGKWGSGKSNVIRILKKNLEKEYFLFEYDAWGNQEDLQRRSFLEQLTQKLVDEKILDGNTEVKKRGGIKETTTWENKLKYLLARKTETISEKYPRISSGIVFSGVIAVLTPVCTYIANATEDLIANKIISILISFLPVLIGGVILIYKLFTDKRYRDINYLFAIYNDKVESEINFETISEDEPTVSEFKLWMNDISRFIGDFEKKKLIVVFDNMDRLPSDKVKELWSSIHTFFSDDCYENIWVIIPFDKVHLANAFMEEDKKKSEKLELTCQFIAKTFPIIYRVPSPIFTDQKEIFYKYYLDAFGNTEEPEKEIIQRLFSILETDRTPRKIIAFINEVVSLKQSWSGEIPLLPIAVYVLKKDEILNSINIDDYILSKGYLKKIERVIEDTEELQNYITALVYGINVEFAVQVPLRQYLSSILQGEQGKGDINQYAENKHFETILEDEVRILDLVYLEKAINSLSKLTTLSITKIWNYLVKIQIEIKPLEKLIFTDSIRFLLKNADLEYKRKLLTYLCENYSTHKDFRGDLFYRAIESVDACLKENNEDVNVSEYINEKIVSPEDFIKYVLLAKEEFKKYKLVCDYSKLDEFLSSALPDKLPNMDFLQYINKEPSFKMGLLKKRIEEMIPKNEIAASNFSEIIKTYKIISGEEQLTVQFSKSQIQALQQAYTTKNDEAYFDLVAMGLCNSIDTPSSNVLIEKVAERIELFKAYGDLLLLAKEWASVLLRNVLKKMTEDSRGKTLNIEKILPLFEEIKQAIGVDEKVFLGELSNWNEFFGDIKSENIETLIPKYSFYTYSSSIKNDLTSYINDIAKSKIESMSTDILYQNINTPTDYWLNTIAIFINNNIIKSLPQNLSELSKNVLEGIAKDQPIPQQNTFLDIILNKANKSALLPKIKSISENFRNGSLKINAKKFMYFSQKFDFLSKIDELPGSIARNIIEPVIIDPECLNEIIRLKITTIRIIKAAGDEANDLISKIRTLKNSNTSESFIEFTNELGLNEEEKEEEITEAENN